jgi:hypothetical protein
MSDTYWDGKGKYKKLYEKLTALIPYEGSVKNADKNPALEKLRIAINAYYDLFNNGLCNREKEFEQAFNFDGYELAEKVNNGTFRSSKKLENKIDEIILAAAKEQNISIEEEN